MAKNGRKARKIAKALGASRVARVKKGWDWKMASPAEKKLCVCGDAAKHLPHCPYNEVGVDFSDMRRVLKELEKSFAAKGKSRSSKRIPKILRKLEKIWKKNPDLRLAQLILNAFTRSGPGAPYGNIYVIEDGELISALDKFYKRYHGL